MNISMILDLAAEAMPHRVAIGPRRDGITFSALAAEARRLGGLLSTMRDGNVAFLDVSSAAVHVVLFGAAYAGRSFVPLSYRLEDAQLRAVAARAAPAVVFAGDAMWPRIEGIDGLTLVDAPEGSTAAPMMVTPPTTDADDVAAKLFTSGTTGEPKIALLRHRHLTSYVLSTVDLMGASEDEASLISVPPYHVAAIAAALTGTFAGRRAVFLPVFDADAWIDLVLAEEITHAMVVPTMLTRIVERLETTGARLPTLRHLSYGGGPMPVTVIERALRALPDVGFVNAYGLTETSSTIAVLGPDEHRAAVTSADESVRVRLGSVGRPLPTVEVSIRDLDGAAVAPGMRGEIWVRGEQVSGEYADIAGRSDEWFATRDEGHLDDDGYLFVHGRLDDVIVRGGENLSPGEIEAVLAQHPAVANAGVVGVPDDEWGERVVAAVVLRPGSEADADELRAHVRAHLRSTKTPDRIDVVDELPFNETGKLLRRVLRERLGAPA